MSNQIERYRKSRNLTRQALAQAAGTNAQQIYRLERGKIALKAHWAQRLAAALNVSVEALLNTAANGAAAPSPSNSANGHNGPATPAVDLVSVAETVLPRIETVDMFTVSGDALAAQGILDGDHLMVEVGGKPARGDIVVLEVYTSARWPQKLARVYDPPFLLSFSLDPETRRPILIDSVHVKIIGVVQGVMRLRS